MSDPILLFLTVDIAALLLLGASATLIPAVICGLVATALTGLGALACLPPLIMRLPATALDLALGPPGLDMQFALDPLSNFFLISVLLAGTIVTAFQATTAAHGETGSMRTTIVCIAGAATALLAADGVTLAIGLAVACGSIWQPRPHHTALGVLLAPLLILTAICLLTPDGDSPSFDVIRTTPLESGRTSMATVLTLAAVAALVRSQPDRHGPPRDTLAACVLIPLGSYLLLRTITDLSGTALQAWWGFILMLAGGLEAVVQAWRAATHPDMDRAIAAMMRRQAGLALTSIGLVLIAREDDLPGAAAFAMEATCLTILATSLAGAVTSLAGHTIGLSANTYRIAYLGGLIHSMKRTSATMAAGLLALSALPPSLGFASLWLSFQSILFAPRTGGLPSLLPLALISGAIALSAALSTAASIRIIGVGILSRPRTPLGAGAVESKKSVCAVLLTASAVSLLAGVLTGPILWLLAEPAVAAVTGLSIGQHTGVAVLSAANASPGYPALPVFALLTFTTAAALLIPRWSKKSAKAVGPWTEGMPPSSGLPFGEPAAQSAGAGFVPTLPALPMPPLPRLPSFHLAARALQRSSLAVAFIWLILAAFGGLLLAVAVMQ